MGWFGGSDHSQRRLSGSVAWSAGFPSYSSNKFSVLLIDTRLHVRCNGSKNEVEMTLEGPYVDPKNLSDARSSLLGVVCGFCGLGWFRVSDHSQRRLSGRVAWSAGRREEPCVHLQTHCHHKRTLDHPRFLITIPYIAHCVGCVGACSAKGS